MPDREKVIGHLNDCMTASRRDNTWVFVRKDIVEDALAMLKEQNDAIEKADSMLKIAEDKIKELLKEQEAVKPYIDIDEAKCPICKVKLTRKELLGDDVLFEDFFDYCPHCGRKVKWE